MCQGERAFGWNAARIEVLDADLGHTAATTEGRDDFTQLAAELALGHVGIVFGWEVSRLARNNADWYQLLDLAALVGALIADIEGVLATALLDRLLHHVEAIPINGRSYRMRERQANLSGSSEGTPAAIGAPATGVRPSALGSSDAGAVLSAFVRRRSLSIVRFPWAASSQPARKSIGLDTHPEQPINARLAFFPLFYSPDRCRCDSQQRAFSSINSVKSIVAFITPASKH